MAHFRGQPTLAMLLWCVGAFTFLVSSECASAQTGVHGTASSTGLDGGANTLRVPTRVRGAERLSSAADRSRYREIVTLVHRNLHLGPHFTMAVDVGTIKALRGRISERDVPILIAILSDRDDHVVAGAAEGLLVILGMRSVEALLTVRRSDGYAAPGAATALRGIQECYSIALWDRRNPDLCPSDRAAHRGEEIPTELPP